MIESLTDLAAVEIERLAAAGVQVTPAEVIEINAVATRIVTGSTREYLHRGNPVDMACGVRLWPLTIQATDWVDRVACGFANARMRAFALAWAMAHCYAKGRPFDIAGARAYWKVAGWAVRRLACRMDALDAAVAEVLAQDKAPSPETDAKDDSPATGNGQLSVWLAEKCGGDPTFWEERCASSYAFAVLRAVIMSANETGDRLDLDPRIQAEIVMGQTLKRIRNRSESDARQADKGSAA